MAYVVEHLTNIRVSVVELARLVAQFTLLLILYFILYFLRILSFIDVVLDVVYLRDCTHQLEVYSKIANLMN